MIVEMTQGFRIRHIYLGDKAVAGFERTDSSLGKLPLWVKCYQTVLDVTENQFSKGKVHQ